MNRRSVDILVVITITLISAILVFVVSPNGVPVRILTLPLVLVLPGYALTSALFPRRALGILEYLLFSLGLSLVIVILGGLVLNWTPFGLRTSSWLVLLGAITLIASAVSLVRRRGQTTPTSGWSGLANLSLTFRHGLLFGLAAIVVGGALAVSIIGAMRQPYPGFTQLWLLPAGGANLKNAVRLGVSNMESTAMKYRLDVNVNGKVVKEWASIDLNPDGKWEATLVLPQTRPATSAAKVEALLYRADAPMTVYRHVVLWLST